MTNNIKAEAARALELRCHLELVNETFSMAFLVPANTDDADLVLSLLCVQYVHMASYIVEVESRNGGFDLSRNAARCNNSKADGRVIHSEDVS